MWLLSLLNHSITQYPPAVDMQADSGTPKSIGVEQGAAFMAYLRPPKAFRA
jgi:hypothetical protein